MPILHSLIYYSILIGGFGAIVFSTILFRKKYFQCALYSVILGGALLRLFVACDTGLHDWDERFHALVAKNMLTNPLEPKLYPEPVLSYDYRQWVGNYIWLHKPPLTMWVMSVFLKIFGIHELSIRLPSIVFASICIYFVYFIGLYIKDICVGQMAATLYAVNGFIIELAGGRVPTDHVDTMFSSFFLFCIFLSIKLVKLNKYIYSILLGICFAALILTKWLIGLFILPLIFLILMEFNLSIISAIVRLIGIFSIASIFIAPWYFYIHTYYPKETLWEHQYNIMHLYKALEEHDGNFLFYIDRIRINYHDLIYLPLLWFFYRLFKNPKDLKLQFLFAWFFLPLIFFSFAKTKMPGYLEFTATSFFIIISCFWFELYKKPYFFRFKYFKKIILILLLALPIRYSIERIKPFKPLKNSSWIDELKKTENNYKGKYVLLNYKANIEAMFYTNLIAYNNCPTQSMINEAYDKGYKVLVNYNDRCNLDNLYNITIVNLPEPD